MKSADESLFLKWNAPEGPRDVLARVATGTSLDIFCKPGIERGLDLMGGCFGERVRVRERDTSTACNLVAQPLYSLVRFAYSVSNFPIPSYFYWGCIFKASLLPQQCRQTKNITCIMWYDHTTTLQNLLDSYSLPKTMDYSRLKSHTIISTPPSYTYIFLPLSWKLDFLIAAKTATTSCIAVLLIHLNFSILRFEFSKNIL